MLNNELALAQQFTFQSYSVREGLAQSQVFCMLEDEAGYLWLGTQGGGLSRFDGLEFESYSMRDGLVSNYIEALYEQEETIFIGTKNGMSVYDGKNFKNYHPLNDQSIAVTAFHPLPNGELLVGTSRGLYRFDGQRLIKDTDYNFIKRTSINCFFEDSEKNIWVGSQKGAWQIKGKKSLHLTRKNGMSNEEVNSITEDEKGNIWLATFNGVNIWNGKTVDVWRKKDGLASNFVLNTYRDHRGNIWLGTQDNGISIWNPVDSTFSLLNDEQGLCNNHVRQVFQDSWKNIWIGTSGGGICKYFGQQFQHRNISNRTADNLVYAVAQDTSGRIWCSASDNGIARLDSTDFTYFRGQNGFVNEKCKAIFQDRKGRMWFGSNGKGIAYLDTSGFHFLENKGDWVGNFTRDFEEDNEGNLWVASASQGIIKVSSRDTLFHLENIVQDTLLSGDSLLISERLEYRDSIAPRFDFYSYSTLNGMPSNLINAIHFDRLGRLWFATRKKGIGYLNDNGIVHLKNALDLAPNTNIRCIEEDELGFLWLGSAGYGIARLAIYKDSLKTKWFDESDGLKSGNVYQMGFDREGQLWVGCGLGVDQLILDAEQNIKEVIHFGAAEGFAGGETCQNAMFRDRDGAMWFGTVNGLSKYMPGVKRKNEQAPKLSLTSLSLFYEPLENTPYAKWLNKDGGLQAGLELPYHQNHLSIAFKGINLSQPTKVRYQYRLKGQDKDWSPLRTERNITYPSIAPGAYVFELRAYNEDDVFNDPPLQVPFLIQTPFWQQWWFLMSGIALLATIIGLVFKVRLNQIKKKAKEERERLEIANNLLQLEQKALQLQMNPHFIFNALNTVQSLFLSDKQALARQLLSKFAKLMRAMLEHSRESTISLQKEVDLLDNYLAIEQFSRNQKFIYEIVVEESLDAEEVQIPPMMIQPFVENAVIHGVNALERGGEIAVHFEVKGKNKLLCSIKDNGIGRAASAKRKEQKTRQHKSTALEVTQERLALINKDIAANKVLTFNDLKNNDQSAAGTEVQLLLPLEEW